MDLFQLVAKLGLDSSEYEKGIGKSKGLISNLGSAVSAKAVAIGNLTADLVKKAAGAIVDLGKTGLSYNQQMEDYTANFRVMLGSTEAAAAKVEELKEMAAHTPFEMSDLANATQTLLAFGIESDKTNDIMQMLGDVSLGNSQKFASLATVFGQVSSTGKLMGQDLLQFINQGFNPLQVIAEKTGASMGDLKEAMSGGKTSKEFQQMVKNAQAEVKKLGANASQSAILLSQIGEDGTISAKMVEEAFIIATTEGGQFYKGMEEASKTQSGLISTLKDNWNALLGKVMKPASDFITSTLLPNAISAVDRLSAAYDQGGFAALIGEAGAMVKEAASALFNNITFPTWEDVKAGFTAAWEGIKSGAASVARFVFGETEGGGIDWPTWEDVKAAFSTAWETIKTGATSVMKLVFGETEDGGIDWPTWGEISAAFTNWWDNTFVPNAQAAMKWTLTVFGMPEESVDEIIGKISEWWGGVKEAAQSATEWALRIPDAPYESGLELHDKIVQWWESVKEGAQALLTWVLGIPELQDIDGSKMREKISTWWTTKVVPFLTDALNFALGVLGLPDVDGTVSAIQTWWDNIVSSVEDYLKTTFGITMPSIESIANKISNWWDSVKAAIGSLFLSTSATVNVKESRTYGGGLSAPAPPTDGRAVGLDYVPYNDYIANLHEGEAVLTKAEATSWRRGETTTAAPASIDYAALGRAVASAITGLSVQMDGQTVGHIVAPTVSADIAEGSRTTRRYAMA